MTRGFGIELYKSMTNKTVQPRPLPETIFERQVIKMLIVFNNTIISTEYNPYSIIELQMRSQKVNFFLIVCN